MISSRSIQSEFPHRLTRISSGRRHLASLTIRILLIDSVKVPLFGHHLYRMEAFLGLVDDSLTQPLNIYESSLGDSTPLHGEAGWPGDTSEMISRSCYSMSLFIS